MENKHDHGTRLATKKKGATSTTSSKSVPSGYEPLSNGFLVGQGISGSPLIYAVTYKGKRLLWWAKPTAQIDDFFYFGDRDDDIKECTRLKGCPDGYTWHHSGHPIEEDHGTMQLVPTDEHSKIPHWGGVAISLGKLS